MAVRFNPRSLRHQLALLAAAVVAASGAIGLLPAQRVAAQDSCAKDDGSQGAQWICAWTQVDNGDWEAGSTSNPGCGNTCDWYLHGNCQYYYYSDTINVSASGVDFHGDMRNAVHAWNGRPYCSPTFYNCNCGSAFLTLTSSAFQYPYTGDCGLGWPTSAWDSGGQQYDNHVVSSEAEYNATPPAQWTQGPSDGTFCDAIAIGVHEVGHAFTEGHSSYPNDVMCASPDTSYCKDSSTIDADADRMLDAVYGPYHNANSGGGSGGCGGCQMACPQTTGVTTTTIGPDPGTTVNATIWTVCGTAFALPDVSGYWAKAWDTFQGVSTPNIPQEITGNSCWPYFAEKVLVPWISCVTGVSA